MRGGLGLATAAGGGLETARQHVLGDQQTGAARPIHVSQRGDLQLEIADRRRHGTLLEDTARRGQQDVPARQCQSAAEDDVLRVEQVDEPDQRLAQVGAGFRQNAVRKAVLIVGRLDDRLDRQPFGTSLAELPELAAEFVVDAGASALHQRRRRNHRLETAAIAARANRTVLIDGDVPQLAGDSVTAAVQLAAQKDRRPDAGSQRDIH